MARHGDRIRKRKDGRWEGRYKTGNNSLGRTVYASVYGRSYTEVRTKLREQEQLEQSMNTEQKVRLRFSDCAEKWLLCKKLQLKKATVHKYEYLLQKHIIPVLGDQFISTIDTCTINNFAESKLTAGNVYKGDNLSKSYVRSMVLIIHSVMTYSAQNGWCRPIPTKVYMPSSEKKELPIFSISQQRTLEKHLIANLTHTSVGILITLQTGLRIGEVCALTWEDLDFLNNILYVRATVSRIGNPIGNGTILIIDTPKTKSSVRAIPFRNSLLNALETIKMQTTSKYVISEKTTFMSPRTFEYRYHKILKELHLPNLNYHALRHTFATRCIEYGVDVKSLSEILGHANVSITLNTYVHSSMDMKRTQLDKLPTLL